jgi:hypothetical protein
MAALEYHVILGIGPTRQIFREKRFFHFIEQRRFVRRGLMFQAMCIGFMQSRFVVYNKNSHRTPQAVPA